MESGDHQDQMEMMLMMQMEKLISHDFTYSDHHPNIPSSSSSSPPSSSSSIMDFTNNINITSPNPMSMSSSSSIIPSTTTTISFTTSPHHQLYPSSSSSMISHHHHQYHHHHQKDNNILISNNNNNKQQQNNSVAAMREMIFRIAAMQPIHIDPESVKPPKRRNVKISKDPQSVAARHRRERISERIRILQRLVPGGTKMDTASMLDEAIHYVKFLKNQVQSLERAAGNRPSLPSPSTAGMGFPVPMSSGTYLPISQNHNHNHVHHYADA